MVMLDDKLCLTSVLEFLRRGLVDRGTREGKVVVVVDLSKRKVWERAEAQARYTPRRRTRRHSACREGSWGGGGVLLAWVTASFLGEGTRHVKKKIASWCGAIYCILDGVA